jgi:hypothetical protein
MKIISIGSSKGCNIHIDSDDISKRHALIYMSSTGKMQLVDTSENGTFINGVRVKSHMMMPVHRKDKVVFANGHQMDWRKVPDPSRKIRMMLVGVCTCLCLFAILYIVVQKDDLFYDDPIEEPIIAESDVKNTISQSDKTSDVKVEEKKKVTTKKDSVTIPSAEELWVGSGKKIVPKPKMVERPLDIKEKSEVAITEAISPQYTDTIVEEPSIELEIEVEGEDEFE